MSEQPKALRLADALSAAIKQVDADDDVIHVARWFVEDADAELRRLHASCEDYAQHKQRQDQRILTLTAQRDALRGELKEATEAINDPAVNNLRTLAESIRMLSNQRDALLEALELLVSYTESCEGLLNASPAGQVLKARAAIKAVEEGK